MVPSFEEAIRLWSLYKLPEQKQIHSRLVATVAAVFANRMNARTPNAVNLPLLLAASLLHDIDKNIPPSEKETHPDTGVRVLRELGMEEVANVVQTHPLHAILDPAIAPKTWEEKILFISDKMVKYAIISLEERFSLWRNEHLPKEEARILKESFPLIKRLEKELCRTVGMSPEQVRKEAKASIGDKGVYL